MAFVYLSLKRKNALTGQGHSTEDLFLNIVQPLFDDHEIPWYLFYSWDEKTTTFIPAVIKKRTGVWSYIVD